MDLKSGGTIYVEAMTDRQVRLQTIRGMAVTVAKLTSEEARILANALLAAVVEAEAQRR